MDIEKVTEAMVNALGTKNVKIDEIPTEEISEYDVLGFSPGIYAFNDDKDLIGFIEENGLQKQEHIHILRVSAEGRKISCSHSDADNRQTVSRENKTTS
jgi:hypothetical protein